MAPLTKRPPLSFHVFTHLKDAELVRAEEVQKRYSETYRAWHAPTAMIDDLVNNCEIELVNNDIKIRMLNTPQAKERAASLLGKEIASQVVGGIQTNMIEFLLGDAGLGWLFIVSMLDKIKSSVDATHLANLGDQSAEAKQARYEAKLSLITEMLAERSADLKPGEVGPLTKRLTADNLRANYVAFKKLEKQYSDYIYEDQRLKKLEEDPDYFKRPGGEEDRIGPRDAASEGAVDRPDKAAPSGRVQPRDQTDLFTPDTNPYGVCEPDLADAAHMADAASATGVSQEDFATSRIGRTVSWFLDFAGLQAKDFLGSPESAPTTQSGTEGAAADMAMAAAREIMGQSPATEPDRAFGGVAKSIGEPALKQLEEEARAARTFGRELAPDLAGQATEKVISPEVWTGMRKDALAMAEDIATQAVTEAFKSSGAPEFSTELGRNEIAAQAAEAAREAAESFRWNAQESAAKTAARQAATEGALEAIETLQRPSAWQRIGAELNIDPGEVEPVQAPHPGYEPPTFDPEGFKPAMIDLPEPPPPPSQFGFGAASTIKGWQSANLGAGSGGAFGGVGGAFNKGFGGSTGGAFGQSVPPPLSSFGSSMMQLGNQMAAERAFHNASQSTVPFLQNTMQTGIQQMHDAARSAVSAHMPGPMGTPPGPGRGR